jgi:Uma2 family endonuclease
MTIAARPPNFSSPQPLRWTGEAFDLASETGVFDGQRVELINGVILERPPMNDPHAQAVQLALYALLPIFPVTTATIRIQLPMRLGQSRPFPDLAVVMGTPRQVTKHPMTALLVVEISDSTIDFDQTEKAELYANHGLPEYWIININGRCLEVRRKPFRSRGLITRYKTLQMLDPDDTVSPLAAPQARIKVADLLP